VPRIGARVFEKEVLAAPQGDFHFWGQMGNTSIHESLNSTLPGIGPRTAGGITRRSGKPSGGSLYAYCPNDKSGVRFLIAEYEETGTVDWMTIKGCASEQCCERVSPKASQPMSGTYPSSPSQWLAAPRIFWLANSMICPLAVFADSGTNGSDR